jgi:uncharacterized protein
MQLGSTFFVPANPSTVFERFLDPNTMRDCIPGCEELARTDETHYSGRLVNQVAHVRFNASFTLEITHMDRPREIKAVLKGEDNRLASSLKVDATLLVEPDGDGSSKLKYTMDLALWGKLGRMGESIFRHRTAEVEREFVKRFSEACAPNASRGTTAAQTTRGGHVAGAATTPAVVNNVRLPWWRRLMAWLGRGRRRT